MRHRNVHYYYYAYVVSVFVLLVFFTPYSGGKRLSLFFRLYSRFLSRIPRTPSFKGATSKTFHDFVVKSVAMYKKCFKEHSIRECAYNATLYREAVVSECAYKSILYREAVDVPTTPQRGCGK